MAEMTAYAPGSFCWAELRTTDVADAKRFYTALFGWEAVDTESSPDAIYTMLRIGGMDVAALCGPDRARAVPPHWLAHVSVQSVDAAADKVAAIGGQIVKAPFDVSSAGRKAVVKDPTGAALALWQPRERIGARIINEPGTICWNELATKDPDAARHFYMQLFGWTAELQQMGPMTYVVLMNGGTATGGLYKMTEDWGDIPSNWLVYFAVEDCDESVAEAKELGAVVRVTPSDIPNVGRFAVIEDPQGAVFAVLQAAAAA